MNWSMRLISVFAARSWVLKNEASIRGGNASWNEKYPTTQIAQISRRTRNALRAIAFAVSRFRLPIPTIRERATEGRIVICQILMNASLERFQDRAEIAKDQPGDDPEDETQQDPGGEVQAGQFHGVFSLRARGHGCTIGRDRRIPARQQTSGEGDTVAVHP